MRNSHGYYVWLPKQEVVKVQFEFLRRIELQNVVMYEVTKEVYQEIKECQQ